MRMFVLYFLPSCMLFVVCFIDTVSRDRLRSANIIFLYAAAPSSHTLIDTEWLIGSYVGIFKFIGSFCITVKRYLQFCYCRIKFLAHDAYMLRLAIRPSVCLSVHHTG